MKIIPAAGPQTTANTNQSPTAQDARARAIARLTEQPVQNANNVQPEEMGAIRQAQGLKHEEVETQSADITEETVIPEPKVEVDSQYQLLARKERAHRAKVQQQEQAIKAREDAIAAKEQELKAKEEEYRSGYISKAQLKRDTVGTLEAEGMSYDELTQQYINRQTPLDPRISSIIERQEAQIAKLLEAQENNTKASTEAQDNQYKAAVKQIKTDVESLVKTDDAYEMVRLTGSVSDVVELIEKTWQQEERLMTVEEAAQEVEDYLIEEGLKLAKAKKVQTRLSSKPAAESENNTQPPSVGTKQHQTMKTLTNATGSSRTLSAKERAILAFKGEKF